MVAKYPLIVHRVRKVPRQFSWVDQRLVREHRIAQCTVEGAALYLFLITVADAQGLSFYTDDSVARYLAMDVARIQDARENLIQADLIAFKRPLYQVLSLREAPEPRTVMDRPLSLGQILKKAMEGRP